MTDFVRKTYRKEIKDDTKIDLEPRRGDIVLSGEQVVGVVMADGTYKELANQSNLEELVKKLPIIQRQHTESSPINVKRVIFQAPQRESDTPLIIHTYDTDNNTHDTFNVGDVKNSDLKALEARVKTLEEKPAGGVDTMLIYGTPLILTEGVITLNRYIGGVTDTIEVHIDNSNWDDTIPVSQLYLISPTDMPKPEDGSKGYVIYSAQMTQPRQTVNVCGNLIYGLFDEKWEWHMTIFCPGKVEA